MRPCKLTSVLAAGHQEPVLKVSALKCLWRSTPSLAVKLYTCNIIITKENVHFWKPTSLNDNLQPQYLLARCHHLALQAACVTINHLDNSNLRNARHLQRRGAQHELSVHCGQDCAELNKKQLSLTPTWFFGCGRREQWRTDYFTPGHFTFNKESTQDYIWSAFCQLYPSWANTSHQMQAGQEVMIQVLATPGKMPLML